MKKPKVSKGTPAGDKAVAIGGFLVVLLTGFFGAEPDTATQVEAHAIISATQSLNHGDREHDALR